MMRIIDVTDAAGRVIAADWLVRAEPVHRQLRPKLPVDYVARMQAIFAGGGRMCVAVMDEHVAGIGVYRIYEDTVNGRKCYVDDLVTDEALRSTGIGRALMQHMESIARGAHCDALALDSGTHRERAHAFYFREGLRITSFNFKKPLAK